MSTDTFPPDNSRLANGALRDPDYQKSCKLLFLFIKNRVFPILWLLKTHLQMQAFCRHFASYYFPYNLDMLESDSYLSRWVTFARATANACKALNGYWKSNVYALPSILPNCITWNLTIFYTYDLEEHVWSYLSTPEFDLKILGAFLSHSAAEIKLVHLAGLVPHGRFVVHHQLCIASYHFRFRTRNSHSSLLEL